MIPFARAVWEYLDELAGEALQQIEDIPEEDLNTWRPALGLQDINTFFALTTHLLGAGEFWILHAAAGQPTGRDRPSEFHATGTLPELKRRFDAWLDATGAYLESVTEGELSKVFERGGDDPVRWTVAKCITHAVEHTAMHVGHLQIQRQIWDAEHRN